MANWKLPADKARFRAVTALTLSRIPVSILFTAIVVGHSDHTDLPRTAVLLLLLTFIEVSDGLDGHLARKWQVGSEWGAMLDPYSDSVARLIVYFGLGVSGLVHPVVMLLMAFRDVTVAYCRILLTQNGRSVAAMLSGKIKAVVQGVGAYAAVLAVFLPLFLSGNPIRVATIVISVVVSLVTLWSIGQYASGALNAVQSKEKT